MKENENGEFPNQWSKWVLSRLDVNQFQKFKTVRDKLDSEGYYYLSDN